MLSLDISVIGKTEIPIKGKKDKYRNVLIPDKLISILKEYLKVRIARPNIDKLFTNKNGNPLSRKYVDVIIKDYGKAAKINIRKLHAHAFRHRTAINLLELGYNLFYVAELLGHSDINTTRIYARKTKGELLKAINSLELI